MSNNLRIIYQNAVDLPSTVITASSEASASTPASNMKRDAKSAIWRSTSGSAKLVVSFSADTTVGGVILPFCNLTSTATMRVRGYGPGSAPTVAGSAGSNPISGFDTTVVAAPYQVLGLWNWGSNPLGSNTYSYGGGTYGRVWLPTQFQGVRYLLIEISDSNAYIEASRLIVGSYWSPKYNTSYGLSTTMKDLSAHERSEAGDLLTNRGVRFNTMNFDLKWLAPSDQFEFLKILKGNGLPAPLLISLFPDNSKDWVKEQAHQIYGKLSQLSPVSHPVLDMYSTTVDIEEI